MADIKSFTFFASYYEALSCLNDDDKAKIIVAICEYAFNGTKPEFGNPVLNGFWKLMLPTLSKSITRSISGQKGQGKSKSKANQKQNKSKTKTITSKDNNNINYSHISDDNNENNILEKENTSVLKKEKPLWKTSYEEYKRLFEKAKQELLADNEFKLKQESYYPSIDYEKSIEKSMDYWLALETWEKVAREKKQSILPKERIKKNFDKNRIYKSKDGQEDQTKEMTLIERHTNFVQWLSTQVDNPYRAMPVFHVTLDDFSEMYNACGKDSKVLAEKVLLLLKGHIDEKDGLIGVFRKNKEGLL